MQSRTFAQHPADRRACHVAAKSRRRFRAAPPSGRCQQPTKTARRPRARWGRTRSKGGHAGCCRLPGRPNRSGSVPHHTVLPDSGIQFADLPKNRQGPTARCRGHHFDQRCLLHGIEHRLTEPNHPWTNGQVERMNRTIKDATVKRYSTTHNQHTKHLNDFLRAYNYDYLCKLRTQTPDRSTLNPIHQRPGLTRSLA
jgi:hypothetical protein